MFYHRVSQIYDLAKGDSDQSFDDYVSMLDHEIKFLFEVFKSSVDRDIDLTPTVYLALDVAQQGIFRIMKHRLGTGALK